MVLVAVERLGHDDDSPWLLTQVYAVSAKTVEVAL
jgi:hypothetical protein